MTYLRQSADRGYLDARLNRELASGPLIAAGRVSDVNDSWLLSTACDAAELGSARCVFTRSVMD